MDMPLDFYIRLQTTINLCSNYLARYLSAANYTHALTTQQVAAEKALNHKVFTLPHPLEENRFILVSSTYKNPGLTAHRIDNVLKVLNDVNQILTDASPHLNAAELEDYYKKIKLRLETGLQNNHKLSALHSKSHFTLDQCRLLRFGFFATLWHVSIFQSRAGRELDRSIKHLEKVLTEFVPVYRTEEILPLPAYQPYPNQNFMPLDQTQPSAPLASPSLSYSG
jgi:hypothetical protein